MFNKYYQWHGISIDGKIISGTQQAISKRVLYVELESKNITVTRIKWMMHFSHAFSTKAIDSLLLRLKTLLNAGISITQALHIMHISQTQLQLKNFIEDLRNQIEQGSSLSEALKKYPSNFDNTIIQMIALGEKTSSLTLVLEHLIQYRHKLFEIKRQIKRTLFYPLLVLLVSIIITGFLMVHVVPNLSDIYRNLNVPLPFATRILINLFALLSWIFPLLLILLFISLWKIKKLYSYHVNFRHKVDKFLLRVPVIGNLIKQINVCGSLFTLSILLLVNLPIKQTLYLVAESCANRCYQDLWLAVNDQVRQGIALSQALQQPLFPSDLRQLILVGEQSSALPELLKQSYQSYQEDLFDHMKQLTQWLEPLSVLLLASIIGTIIVVMYLPIFQLGHLF